MTEEGTYRKRSAAQVTSNAVALHCSYPPRAAANFSPGMRINERTPFMDNAKMPADAVDATPEACGSQKK